MVHVQIDPQSGIPVYRQIMDQIKYYVASGTLAAGAKLPSIREMSKELRVNPTTIVKSYNELAHQGVIEMRHGSGAFVAEAGSGMTAKERAAALRRIARQLAVEAVQMGASEEEVLDIVARAMKDVAKGAKK